MMYSLSDFDIAIREDYYEYAKKIKDYFIKFNVLDFKKSKGEDYEREYDALVDELKELVLEEPEVACNIFIAATKSFPKGTLGGDAMYQILKEYGIDRARDLLIDPIFVYTVSFLRYKGVFEYPNAMPSKEGMGIAYKRGCRYAKKYLRQNELIKTKTRAGDYETYFTLIEEVRFNGSVRRLAQSYEMGGYLKELVILCDYLSKRFPEYEELFNESKEYYIDELGGKKGLTLSIMIIALLFLIAVFAISMPFATAFRVLIRGVAVGVFFIIVSKEKKKAVINDKMPGYKGLASEKLSNIYPRLY